VLGGGNRFDLPHLQLNAIGNALPDAAQISFGACKPQDSDEGGQCVHIASCPYLANLLTSTGITPAQRELLKLSQCGLDNRKKDGPAVNRILVCCPQSKRSGATEVQNPQEEEQSLAGNVLPGDDICGFHFADRIVGGTNTTLWEFPWMVLLQYKKLSSGALTFNCGGSLINSRYVLTAGHCLRNSKLDESKSMLHSVRLGEWDTRTDPDCVTQMNGKRLCAPPHIDIGVEKGIIHEQYRPNSVDQRNDIALVRLKRSVTFTDYVRPICLPLNERSNLFNDHAMDAAGWGLTENNQPSPVKLKITVNVWSLSSCQEKYNFFKVMLNNTQMCAGGEHRVDTCSGDSGGPLMVTLNSGPREVFYIAGITSFGPESCGFKGWPGVYTRTGAYIDWIQEKLEA
ncbi:hypothetical protein KR018_010776, partial [Drosophila ironensis]